MQADLFDVPQSADLARNHSQKLGFLEKPVLSLRFDHAIVWMIGLLVVFVLIFSFGVEKGKQFAMAELKAERAKREQLSDELGRKVFELREANQTLQASVSGLPVDVSPVKEQKELPERTAATEKPVSNLDQIKKDSQTAFNNTVTVTSMAEAIKQYTIQLVTFTSQSMAEQAVKKFSDQGYKAFIIPSGRFQQICINVFPSRDQAAKVLRDLRTKGFAPADAYVRLAPPSYF